MLSHIVEQGRERCHQLSTAVSGMGQRPSKASGVLQTWPMKSHSSRRSHQKPLLAAKKKNFYKLWGVVVLDLVLD